MRAQPLPWLTICCSRPFRSASSCVTTPTYSSGTSIARRSTGSLALAVDLLRQHLRLADGELEALAAHQLDEDRELELAAALHLPRVRPRGRDDAQRDVADELGVEPLADLARGQPGPLRAGERARVDADRDRQGRLVDGRDRQRPRVVGVGDRLADRHLGEAGERDDLARPGLVGGDAVERLGDVELGRARVLDRPVGAAPRDRRALAERAVPDPEQREPADVRARVEVRDERLQRVLRVVARRAGSSRAARRTAASGPARARPGSSRRGRRARSRTRSGTRSATRPRRGRGRARRPRSRPPRVARRAGRPC